MKILWRIFLVFIPFLYVVFIWWQSSQFDPKSVFALTSILGKTIVIMIGAGLELAHLFEFGLLYLFIILGFLALGYKYTQKKEFAAFFISVLYGLIDEIHQSFVPFRSLSVIDLIKDVIGVVVFWFLIRYFYRKRDSRIGMRLRKISHGPQKDVNM